MIDTKEPDQTIEELKLENTRLQNRLLKLENNDGIFWRYLWFWWLLTLVAGGLLGAQLGGLI